MRSVVRGPESSSPRRDEDITDILWLVVTAALVVRIGIGVALDGFRHPDLQEWDVIARNIVAGLGFTHPHLGVIYYSSIEPLMAWIAAASYWLSGSIVPAMLLQVAAGTVGAVVVALLARRLFGGRVAPLAAGLLVAFHPGLAVYAAAKSHALVFVALLFSLALLQSFRLAERLDARRAVQFGLIIGVGILARPTMAVFAVLASLWLLAVSRGQRAAVVRCVAVAAVCAALFVVPWTIRNSVIHGRFVFMITTDSEVFWRGNNPRATGTSYVNPDLAVLEAMPPAEKEDFQRQTSELAQSDWFAARARTFIRENPAEFVRLSLVKFRQFWTLSPQTGMLYPRSWLWLYLTYYLLLCTLAVAGLRALVRGGGAPLLRACLLGGFLLGLSGLQSLFYVEGRHRWSVESLVIVLSGGGVAAVVPRRLAR